MKKIFTLIAMAVFALSANAQNTYGIFMDETTQNGNPVHGTYELLYGGSSADKALTSITYTY